MATLQLHKGFAGERAGWRVAEEGGLGEVFGLELTASANENTERQCCELKECWVFRHD